MKLRSSGRTYQTIICRKRRSLSGRSTIGRRRATKRWCAARRWAHRRAGAGGDQYCCRNAKRVWRQPRRAKVHAACTPTRSRCWRPAQAAAGTTAAQNLKLQQMGLESGGDQYWARHGQHHWLAHYRWHWGRRGGGECSGGRGGHAGAEPRYRFEGDDATLRSCSTLAPTP